MNVVKWLVILIVLNAASALGVVHNQHEKRINNIKYTKLHEEKERLNDRWSQLVIEYALWSGNSRIEKIAKEQLGMKYEYENYVLLKL